MSPEVFTSSEPASLATTPLMTIELSGLMLRVVPFSLSLTAIERPMSELMRIVGSGALVWPDTTPSNPANEPTRPELNLRLPPLSRMRTFSTLSAKLEVFSISIPSAALALIVPLPLTDPVERLMSPPETTMSETDANPRLSLAMRLMLPLPSSTAYPESIILLRSIRASALYATSAARVSLAPASP